MSRRSAFSHTSAQFDRVAGSGAKRMPQSVSRREVPRSRHAVRIWGVAEPPLQAPPMHQTE